jgi:hypothetical protein
MRGRRVWRFYFTHHQIWFLGAERTYYVTFTSEDRANW